MDAEAAARAFDRFYRGGHNGNGGHGSGLGFVHRAGDRRRSRAVTPAQVDGRSRDERAGVDPVPSPAQDTAPAQPPDAS